MTVWRPVADEGAGILFNLSDAIAVVEERHPNVLAPVANGIMIVASDYSGQHKDATHEAYSFLITTDASLSVWLPLREKFRERWLPDGRRISFKKLAESLRWKSLPAYLELSEHLSGNLITVLVDRRVGSFMQGGPEAVISMFPECFEPDSNHGTVEKMLRLSSFIAVILSGLRREDQISNWVSDHDEALDSYKKRESIGILSSCLTFGLTGWRRPAHHWFGTTGSEEAPYWAEDIAAIPDLVAGAYCKMSSYLPAFFEDNGAHLVALASSGVKDDRARAIGNWIAAGSSMLKHLLLRLEIDDHGAIRCSAQAFLNNIRWSGEGS